MWLPMADDVLVNVDGHRLKLSNLDKVLYPETGFTKGEGIDDYVRVSPVLLPHLADRPVTLRRFPDGVEGESFYEKDVSRHAPRWVRIARLPTPGSRKNAADAGFVIVDNRASLVWLANLAALELHVPQWTVRPRGGQGVPDLLVFDLDPGEPATVVDCCRVAERIRDVLAEDDLPAFAKTSGSKGLQVYVPVRVTAAGRTSEYARAVAERLAAETPDRVVATMTRARRTGKVLIDWSQNNPAKTTVAPYSLRARPDATVSTPLSWEEVDDLRAGADPGAYRFRTDDVLDRVERYGDLFTVDERGRAPLPEV
jgi:bifunctional non-homologous end joining protein LigD